MIEAQLRICLPDPLDQSVAEQVDGPRCLQFFAETSWNVGKTNGWPHHNFTKFKFFAERGMPCAMHLMALRGILNSLSWNILRNLIYPMCPPALPKWKMLLPIRPPSKALSTIACLSIIPASEGLASAAWYIC